MLTNTVPPLKELVPVTPRGEATRKKLLASAEVEFGSKGFPAASVSSITQRAEVGQGTFYLYFHSKEEVFATLVREIGALFCQQVEALTGTADSLKESERLLALTLGGFVVEQTSRHRILREAQFIDPPVFRETLEKLLASIARVLGSAGRKSDLTLRAAALLGAAEQAALLQSLWGGKPLGKSFTEAVFAA